MPSENFEIYERNGKMEMEKVNGSKGDSARNRKRIKIFLIVRVIRHRGIRGDDLNEGDAERSRYHSAGCYDYIIDYESRRKEYIKQHTEQENAKRYGEKRWTMSQNT